MDAKYLNFQIDREHETEITVKDLILHTQKVFTTAKMNISVTYPNYADMKSTLDSIAYEYKQFLMKYKEDGNCSFNLTIMTVIDSDWNKKTLCRLGYYRQYGETTKYSQRSPEVLQTTEHGVSPITVNALIVMLDYAISGLMEYARVNGK
jgi:hypothetical protein